MFKNKFAKLITVLAFMSVFACVTINIYFPAEKVESMAGEIVDEIRGTGSDEKTDNIKKDQTSIFNNIIIELSGSIAWADDVTTVSNPAIRTLKQNMKQRFSLIRPYFQKGFLKEGDNGYLSIQNADKLDLRNRKKLNSLVNAENNDRKSLYNEVGKALKINASQINKIESIFAQKWKSSVQ